MKNITLVFAAILLTLLACNGEQKEQINTNNSNKENTIEVLDFYGTHRCITCESIETNTQYTLETYFEEELKSGEISFHLINVDKKENYDIAEKFEATGTALFLNVIIDHKETIIDLTDFAFMKGKDKEVFSKELKLKIENELSKL